MVDYYLNDRGETVFSSLHFSFFIIRSFASEKTLGLVQEHVIVVSRRKQYSIFISETVLPKKTYFIYSIKSGASCYHHCSFHITGQAYYSFFDTF